MTKQWVKIVGELGVVCFDPTAVQAVARNNDGNVTVIIGGVLMGSGEIMSDEDYAEMGRVIGGEVVAEFKTFKGPEKPHFGVDLATILGGGHG